MAGSIKSLAYHKDSGGDTSPIESVNIYLKHTNQTSLSSGNYNLNGYTLVYSGSFPNISTSGWMEVNLSPMFSYDGESNLGILVIKACNNGLLITRIGDAAILLLPVPGKAGVTHLSQLIFNQLLHYQTYCSDCTLRSCISCPENFTALPSHQSVLLSWDAPSSGVPTGYKNIQKIMILLLL